jgi:hypothetical protein
MFTDPSRALARTIALAASAALIFGSIATPARAAAEPTLIPTPDFTVVAAWPQIVKDADTGEKVETDFVLVVDADGFHRWDGAAWSVAKLPQTCTDLSFGRMSSAGVVPVICPGTVALYDIEANAAVAGSITVPADAAELSANATLAVYKVGDAWFSQAYDNAAAELPIVGTPITVIAGADLSDDVEGRTPARVVEAFTRDCEDTTVCTTQTLALDLGNDTELLQSFSDIEALTTFSAAGPMALAQVRYPEIIDGSPAQSFLYVRLLDAEGIWAAAEDSTFGTVAGFTPGGVLTTVDGAYQWFGIADDGGSLSFSAPLVLDTGEYTGLSFISGLPSGTPITKYTDAAGVVGLARVTSSADAATLTEITHLQVVGSDVTISGTTMVGETLTADTGEWTPSDAVLAYQWYADGEAISGATGASFTLTSAELGSAISVKVTGAKAGYETTVKASAATAPVTDLVPGTVEITGTVAVGQTLSVALANWPTGSTFAYSWLRGTTVVGTAATYTVTAADAGSQLSVQVTATVAGHTAVAAVSEAESVPAAGKQFTAAPRPAILGWPQVGRTLVVLPGLWRPVPVKLSAQWYRDGVAIRGATKATYRLTKADRGSRITVAVTGAKSGYVTTTKVSSATSRVR